MDVNTRIDRMDEELKLIKNEIKQVLLEIQEHVLMVQNPFTAVVARGRPDEAADSAADSAPISQRAAVDAAVAEPPAPRADPVAAIQPASVASPPPGVPAAGFQYAPQAPSPVPAYVPQQTQAPPPPPPPPPPVAHTQPIDAEIERPPDPPRDRPAEPKPDKNGRPASRERREVDLNISTPSSPDPDDDEGDLDAASDSWTRDEPGDFEDELESREPGVSADDVSGEPADVKETVENTRRSAPNRAGAGPVEPQPKTRVDLATLASMVQWTHRVVQDTGAEYAATLFEISEMTGRLSSDLQQVLLAVVRLLNTEASGSTDSVARAVTLLAQLDGLMGNTTQDDARLLPFLLRGDLEVLPLIQR